jgi:hypothetical protein
MNLYSKVLEDQKISELLTDKQIFNIKLLEMKEYRKNAFVNGKYELELVEKLGDYTVFRQLNAHDESRSYIVAWMAEFKGSKVNWSQGHYDLNTTAVIGFLSNVDRYFVFTDHNTLVPMYIEY